MEKSKISKRVEVEFSKMELLSMLAESMGFCVRRNIDNIVVYYQKECSDSKDKTASCECVTKPN